MDELSQNENEPCTNIQASNIGENIQIHCTLQMFHCECIKLLNTIKQLLIR